MGTTRIHVGTKEVFGQSVCYVPIDAHDTDEVGDMAAELRRRLAITLPKLPPCTAAAAPSLAIIYQAGRGACIDCELPKDQWSGFAFIIVNDSQGHELASAEWQGERAGDGHVLMQKFVKDLGELMRTPKH